MQIGAEIESRVVEIMKRALKVQNLTGNAKVGDPLEWSSLTHIACMLAIEDEFGVKIGAGRLARLGSIVAIVNFLESEIEGTGR